MESKRSLLEKLQSDLPEGELLVNLIASSMEIGVIVSLPGGEIEPINQVMHNICEDTAKEASYFFQQAKNKQKIEVADTYEHLRTFTMRELLLAHDYRVLLVQDVSTLMCEEHEVQFYAYHDALTMLPNRNYLYKILEDNVSADNKFAFMLLDLDGFKGVNNTLGHAAGDQLLQQAAGRLSTDVKISGGGEVARVDGDEFALSIPCDDTREAIAVATRIGRSFKEPFVLNNNTITIGVTIGIACYPQQAKNPQELLQYADIALRSAVKKHTFYTVYEERENPYSEENLKLQSDLRIAVENNELTLDYQPQVNAISGKITGLEALARWKHPDFGFISPGKFISMAEDSGLIHDFSTLVVNKAMDQICVWQDEGIDISVSINLSAYNLLDPNCPELFKTNVAMLDVDPSRITLEITESSLMVNPDIAKKNLYLLDHMGVNLAIDDYGTGYSSLAYLQDLPLSELKIDRTFIKDLKYNKSDEVIVRSTIELAHALGLKVVAEGIEDNETLELLKALGCDTIQGYYTGKPMSVTDATTLLEEQRY